jgi:hypothetical protein
MSDKCGHCGFQIEFYYYYSSPKQVIVYPILHAYQYCRD